MENIKKEFVQSFKKHLTPECLLSLTACLNCKKCGQACAWYVSEGNPENHPIVRKRFLYEIYQHHLTLWGQLFGTLGTLPSPSLQDIEKIHGLFWECTLCGRCSMSCPLGLNNRALFKAARMAYSDAGISDNHPTLKSIYTNTRDMHHSYGLSKQQVYLRVGFFLRYFGMDVPIDVPDQRYLFLCPAVGNTKIPDYAIKFVKLLNIAQVPYTLSSQLVDTGTEIDHIVGHKELSRQMLMQLEQEGERLNAHTLVVGECGCDIRTFMVESSELLGRPFKFPIITADEILLEAVEKNQIPIEPVLGTFTYHDPCYVERLSNMGHIGRELISKVTMCFKEMEPNRKLNYCCNGGAGPTRLTDKAEKRLRTSSLKADQILQTEADFVVTPCAVCMLTLEDICKNYHLNQSEGRMAYLVFEVVYEAASTVLRRQNEEGRFKQPSAHIGKSQEFIEKHSMRSVLKQILQHPDVGELLDWLKDDEIIHRFIQSHPEAQELLEELTTKDQKEIKISFIDKYNYPNELLGYTLSMEEKTK